MNSTSAERDQMTDELNTGSYEVCMIASHSLPVFVRGTQRNYLFGRPLIPYNFLEGIFSSNFPGMKNLRPSVFGLIKMSFRVTKKEQLKFSERK